MNKRHITLRVFLFATFTLALAALAQAQATRTWVSGVGDDVNPCSRTAPCKTWAGAISKTAAGGEIDALDPGGFGTLTITKSIMIEGTNGQGFGSTLNSGGINGFVINDSLSGTPNSIRVVLRNLSINGAGTTLGLNGIRFIAGKALTVENVSIANQSNRGIDVAVPASVDVFLKNVNITNCGGTTGSGIKLSTTSGFVFASMDGVRIENSGNVGLEAANGARATVTNSVIARHAAGTIGAGILGSSGSEVNVADSAITGNIVGARADAGSIIRVSNNFVTQNSTGLHVNGGTIRTFGNNRLDANGTNVTGTLTSISPAGT